MRDGANAQDEEGREFASFDHAVLQATHDARDLAAQDVRAGHLDLDHGLEIAAEDGEIMLTMLFREVFTVKG
jgi:hypothetical protein